jgi:hypothetical protein
VTPTAVTPGYREVEITEQDPEYLSRKMPIERFYADWSASSAGRLANHLFDHWAVRFSDHEDDRGRHCTASPSGSPARRPQRTNGTFL